MSRPLLTNAGTLSEANEPVAAIRQFDGRLVKAGAGLLSSASRFVVVELGERGGSVSTYAR
jgi:hypothetical protein